MRIAAWWKTRSHAGDQPCHQRRGRGCRPRPDRDAAASPSARGEVRAAAADEVVEHDDLAREPSAQQLVDDVRADEAGAAGDQNALALQIRHVDPTSFVRFVRTPAQTAVPTEFALRRTGGRYEKIILFFEHDLVGKPVPIFPDHAHAAFRSSDTTVAQGRERRERIFAQSRKEASRILNQDLHLRNKLSAVFINRLVGRHHQLVRLRARRYARPGLGALTAMPKRPRR